MRDIAIAGDLVGGVDHDDTLAEIVGEHPGDLAEQGRLPDAGAAEQQDALPGLHHVADDLHGPVHRTTDAKRETDDLPGAVTDRADAVERALDARAVVPTELTDPGDDVGDVFRGHLALGERLLATGEACLGPAAEIHDDLEQTFERFKASHPLTHVRRQAAKQILEVVRGQPFTSHPHRPVVSERIRGRPLALAPPQHRADRLRPVRRTSGWRLQS